MTINAPFNLIAGSNLGISRSTLSTLGNLNSSDALGAAKQQIFSNASNGNLTVVDTQIPIEDVGCKLKLGIVYNSQDAVTPWRFNQGKKINPVSGGLNQAGSSITITEADGALTVFNYDSTLGKYVATGLADGNELLTANADGTFNWSQASSGLTEQYNAQGLQTNRVDLNGNTITYQYNSQGQLSQLNLPSGQQIVLNWQANSLAISLLNNGTTTTLINYDLAPSIANPKTFQVNATHVANVNSGTYDITYTYDPVSTCLQKIQQTDGTNFTFGYEISAEQAAKISSLVDGMGRSYSQTYSGATTTVTDPNQENTILVTDGLGRLKSFTEPLNNNATQTTNYAWNADNSLAAIVEADNATTQFSYDGLGCLTLKTDALAHQTQIIRDPVTGFIISRSKFLVTANNSTQALTTYYANDANGNKIFKINPLGAVTFYSYDSQGNRLSKRKLLNNTYTVTPPNPITTPLDLATIQTWWQQTFNANPQATTLTSYTPNSLGQEVKKQQFANLDNDGNGVADDFASCISTNWDCFSNILSRTEKQTSTDTTSITQTFDGLQRPLSKIEAVANNINYQTNWTYQDSKSQILIALPNGLNKLITKDQSDKIISDQETEQATGITRTTQFQLDSCGRPFITTLPDGRQLVQFYDPQGRLAFEVKQLNQTGTVTYYTYDVRDNRQDIIRYNTAIDFTTIAQQTTATLLTWASSAADPNLDRWETVLHDWVSRKRYTISGENEVAETVWDSCDRQTGTIEYATALTSDIARVLSADGETLTGIETDVDDIWNQTYYANDDKVIGSQDGDGYVTQYIRNAAGFVLEKIGYNNPGTPQAQSLSDANIQPSTNDANTTYFNDNRGQRLGKINAGGGLRQYTWTANSLLQQKQRYYNPANANATSLQAAIPDANPEDETHTHEYDLLKRETAANLNPFGIRIAVNYDANDQIISHSIIDLQAPAAQPIFRETDYQRNAWGQVLQELNPMAAMDLAAANAIPDPVQRAAAVAQVWAVEATTHTYDASGLLLATSDPTAINPSGRTVYYYDDQRRLQLAIRADGSMLQFFYDAFDLEVSSTYGYTATFPGDITQLTGGFATTAILNQIAAVADPAADIQFVYQYDRCGRDIQITDPDGFTTTKLYDAFSRTRQVTQLVDATTDTATVTLLSYNRRNQLQQQIDDATKLAATRTYSRNNYYGRCTNYQDANGQWYTLAYDRLGQRVALTNPLTFTRTQQFDNLRRIKNYSDFSGNLTTETYNTAERTTTETSPMGRAVTTTLNAFRELAKQNDADNASITKAYDPNGETIAVTDSLGHTTTDVYDLLGQHQTHQEPNGLVIQNLFDVMHRIKQQIDDPSNTKTNYTGLDITRNYEYDTQSRTSFEQSGRGIWKQTAYNRRGLATQTILDPTSRNASGINLSTTDQYDGLKNRVYRARQDASSLFEQAWDYDGLGHCVANTLNPNGSNGDPIIETQAQYDLEGDRQFTIDANQNKFLQIFNADKKLCFVLAPNGNLVEMTRDPDGRLLNLIVYSQRLSAALIAQITASTTDVQLSQLLITNGITSSGSKICARRYDSDGKLVFEVEFTSATQSIVTEIMRDPAGKKIGEITYSDPITGTDFLTTTAPDDVGNLLSANYANDRANMTIQDSSGQTRFLLDGSGYVTQRILDQNNNEISRIRYATKLIWSSVDWTLTPDALVATFSNWALQNATASDQVNYTVYDRLSRPIYVLTMISSGQYRVAQCEYDADDNPIFYYTYTNPIAIPVGSDPNGLTSAVMSNLLQGNPVWRKTQEEWDAAERNAATIDGLGNAEYRTFNALDQLICYKDKCGYLWNYFKDAAGREVGTASPSTTIITTALAANNASLTTQAQASQTITLNTLDANGNKKIVTKGFGTWAGAATQIQDPRTVAFGYDITDKLISTSQAAVTVDNAGVDNPLSTTPTIVTPIGFLKIRDTNGNIVAFLNDDGYWQYKIWDSAERLAFTIDANFCVTAYAYNNYGQPVSFTRYDAKINFNGQDYSTTGVPLAICQAFVTANANSAADRIVNLSYDQRGLKTQVQLSNALFYNNPTGAPGAGNLTQGAPTSNWVFDAFRNIASETKIIDSVAGTQQQNLRWYDAQKNIIAEVDPDGGVTLFIRDQADGLVSSQVEYGNPIDLSNCFQNGAQISYSQLLPFITPSATDKITNFVYDNMGVLRQHINPNQTTQQNVINSDGTLAVNTVVSDLVTAITPDAMGRTISKTFPNGGVIQTARNEVGLTTTKVLPARTGRDSNGDTSTLLQTVALSYNAHGNNSVHTEYIENTSKSRIETPKTSLRLWDNRGKCSTLQREDGSLAYNSYTVSGMLARNWFVAPVPTVQNGVLGWGLILRQVRQLFDEMLQPTYELRKKPDGTDDVTQWQYNSFGEQIAEGPGDGTFPIQHRFDQNGFTYLNLEIRGSTAIASITLSDLRGQASVVFTAQTTDLSQIAYASIPSLMSQSYKTIQRTELIHNLSGYLLQKNLPGRTNSAGQLIQPSIIQILDRWGHNLSYIDEEANRWDNSYTPMGGLAIRTEPITVVTDATGASSEVRPVTYYGYDVMGNQIAITDANNHIKQTNRNLLGEVIATINGSYPKGALANILDGYGRIVAIGNYIRMLFLRTYTLRDDLASETDGQQNTTKYFNGPVHERIEQTDAKGYSTLYYNDAYNNVYFTYLPGGGTITAVFDRNRQIVYFNDGGVLPAKQYARSYRGFETQFIDRAGAVVNSTYNNSGKVLSRIGTAAVAGHGNWMNILINNLTQAEQVPAQSIFNQYDEADGLIGITDYATLLKSVFYLNPRGMRIEEFHYNLLSGKILYNMSVTFNAARLPVAINNNIIQGYILWDAVYNQRATIASNASTKALLESVWHTYDEANRIVIYRGALSNNQIILITQLSQQFTYGNDGWPCAVGVQLSPTVPVASFPLTFYGNGLADQNINFIFPWFVLPITRQSATTYDADNQPIGAIAKCTELPFTSTTSQSSTWNPNGNQLTQYSINTFLSRVNTENVITQSFDGAGNILTQILELWQNYSDNPPAPPLPKQYFDLTTTYSAFDEMEVMSQTAVDSQKNQVTVFTGRNPNGHIACVWSNGTTQQNFMSQLPRFMIVTYEGQMIYALENILFPKTSQAVPFATYFIYVNGQVWGQCAFNNGQLSATFGNSLPLSMPSFAPPRTITVTNATTTYDELAAQYLTSSTLGWMIAQANGAVSGSDYAIAGRPTKIPAVQGTLLQNNANTGSAFNPEQEFGDVSAILPQPKPPKPPKHNFWDCLIETFVDLGLLILLPELTPLAAMIHAGTATMLIAYAITGAAATAAEEVTALALNDKTQRNFSVSEVIQGAVVNAVTQGLGSKLGLNAGVIGYRNIAKSIFDNYVMALMTQAVQCAVGEQKYFDWQTLVGQTLGGAVNNLANAGLGQMAYSLVPLIEGTLNNAVTQIIISGLYGKIYWGQVIGQSLGTGLAYELQLELNLIKQKIQEEVTRQLFQALRDEQELFEQQTEYRHADGVESSLTDDGQQAAQQTARANNGNQTSKLTQTPDGSHDPLQSQTPKETNRTTRFSQQQSWHQTKTSFFSGNEAKKPYENPSLRRDSDTTAKKSNDVPGTENTHARKPLASVQRNEMRQKMVARAQGKAVSGSAVQSSHAQRESVIGKILDPFVEADVAAQEGIKAMLGYPSAKPINMNIAEKIGYISGVIIGLSSTSMTDGLTKIPSTISKFGIFKTTRTIPESADKLSIQTGSLSAGKANEPFIKDGKLPPYAQGSRARIVKLNQDRIFVRVHGDSNKYGPWLMRQHQIEGLTPQEIKNKFALPSLPTHVSEVYMPTGSFLQVGRVAPQVEWGEGGAIQYQSLTRTNESWFSESRLIPNNDIRNGLTP